MAATIQTIEKPTRARTLDTSGNNNHAQIYSGRALEFDGVTDYLSVSGSATPVTFVDYTAESTAANRAWTVAVWFNYDAVGTSPQYILGYDDGHADNASCNYLRLSDTETLNFYDLGGGASRNADTVLKPGTWYRAVWVYNGSDTINFYVNGAADGSGTLTAGDNNNADLNVGIIGTKILSGVMSHQFAGKMSDLQAWQGAWTQSDVTYDYLNPEQLALNNGGTSLTNSNLKLWYPMNNGHRGNQSYVLDASNTGLGDEMTTNGDFSNGSTGWTTSVSNDSTVTISGGGATITNDGTTGYGSLAQASATFDANQVYKLTFDITAIDLNGGANIAVYDYNSNASKTISAHSATGSVTSLINSNGTDGIDVRAIVTNGQSITLDNISVKPVNYKNNATTVFYGDNTIVAGDDNRDMGGANDWAPYGTGTAEDVTTTAGKLTVTTTTANAVQGASLPVANAGTPVVGRTYRIRAKLKRVSGLDPGTIVIYYGGVLGNITTVGGGGTTGQITNSEVEYETTVTATDASGDLLIVNPATTTALVFEIDDVEIKEVGIATGWTDADQQLDISQIALQSYNQLAWFDGVADYVSIADHNDFSFGDGSTTDSAFSVSGWVFTNEATKCRIISKQDEWLLTLNGSDKPLFSLYDNNASHQEQKVAADALTAGKWYHIVGTYDGTGGTSANGGMELYVNGESVGTNTDAGTYAAMHNKSNAVLIGSFGIDSSFTDGCVTECSIWNKELSATEVTELYNSGLALDATTHSGSSNLIGYWRNNGVATWQDLTANDRDGTPTSVTETMLITAGADSSRDSQGFLMNRQRATNSLNLHDVTEAGGMHCVVSNNPTLQFGSGGSVAFWMKPAGTPANLGGTILSNGAGSSRNPRIILQSNKKIRLFWEIADGTNKDTEADSAVTTDVWTYVACTWDGTTNKIYYNNALDATESESGTPDTDTTNMYIGIDQTNVQGHFEGEIDDLVIYSDILSLEEVKRNYNAGKRSHR